MKKKILNLKQKIKDSKLKYYLIFPLYFIILIGIDLLKLDFLWLHTAWLILTIGLGTYIIVEGDKFIPHVFKPKLGTVEINKNKIERKIPVLSKEIIKKFEVK